MVNIKTCLEETRLWYAIDLYITDYMKNDADTYENTNDLCNMLLDSNVFFENISEIDDLFDDHGIRMTDYQKLLNVLVSIGYDVNNKNIVQTINNYLKEFIIHWIDDIFETYKHINK